MSDSRFCTVGFFLGCLWLVLVNVALLWGNQRLTGVWAYPSGLPMAGAGIAMSLGFAGCVIYGPGVLAFLFGRRREQPAADIPATRRQAPTLPQEPTRTTRAPFRVASAPAAATRERAIGRRLSIEPLEAGGEPAPLAAARPAPPTAALPPAGPGAAERAPLDDRFKPMPMVVRRRTPLMVHERRDWIAVDDDEAPAEQPTAPPPPVAAEIAPGLPVTLPPLRVPTAETFEAIEPLVAEPPPPVPVPTAAPPAPAEPVRRAPPAPIAPVRQPVVARAPLMVGGSFRDRRAAHLRPVAPDRPEDADHSAASGRPAAALRSA